jgi:hypothetical protein
MPKAIILKGRYGKLVALEPVTKRSPQGGVYWSFQCDCGRLTEHEGSRVEITMRTLVFNDQMLRHRSAAREVHFFMSGVMAANPRAIDSAVITINSEDPTKLSLIIQCPHEYASMLIEGINETLIEARLNMVHGCMLQRLMWKFSSPALTSAFRSAILPVPSEKVSGCPSSNSK